MEGEETAWGFKEEICGWRQKGENGVYHIEKFGLGGLDGEAPSVREGQHIKQ